MPRPSKGARLWLRRRKGREPQWVILDGKDEIRTGCSEGERQNAQDALDRHKASRYRVNAGERDPSRIPVAEVLKMYADTRAIHHAAPELVSYHMGPLLNFWGSKSLANVRGQSCREYAEWRTKQNRHGKPISSGTARRELETLQAAVNAWHKESPLPAVPQVTLPPTSPARERYLNRGEAARLLASARRLKLPHIARFILIGLYTGTRHSALLSLRWLPSPDAGWVDVDQAVLYRRGFGEKETSKRRPPARLPGRLLVHLRRWHRMDSAQGIVGVVTWQGAQIVKERRAWARVVKDAGLGPDVTPHVLRHTCATWGLRGGLPIWDVAALLGTSAAMIERTYGHHSPEFQSGVSWAFYGRGAGTRAG